jgi:hypothetical protein
MKMDETCKEMIMSILVFGLFVWLVGLFFVKDRLLFSTGLWLGILAAALAGWHMWFSLNRGLDLGDGATKYILTQNMVRYGLIVIAYGIICITGIGNPIAAFIGIMGLKAGAYMQPFTHKVLSRLKRR